MRNPKTASPGDICLIAILLMFVFSVGHGPTVYVEISRLCFLGMIGLCVFSSFISKKLFIFGEASLWSTMTITAIWSTDFYLIMISICIFALIALTVSTTFAEMYFNKQGTSQNPTQ